MKVIAREENGSVWGVVEHSGIKTHFEVWERMTILGKEYLDIKFDGSLDDCPVWLIIIIETRCFWAAKKLIRAARRKAAKERAQRWAARKRSS